VKGLIVHIDWDRGHGPVSGPFNAAVSALALSYAGHVAHLPADWALAAAGAGLLGTAVAGRRKRWPWPTLALHAAAWLATGAWCRWAVQVGPWHPPVIAALAAGAIGLGISLVGAHRVEEEQAAHKADVEAAVKRATMDYQRQKIADEWDARIALVCTGATVKIVGVEMWESGAGLTLDAECLGGTKWRDLVPYCDSLAAEARLPEGCGVEMKAGQHRGAVLIDVATVNALIDDADYPTDYSPLSLDGPNPHGIYRDGTDAAPNLRERSGFTAGRRGSGKTNLMNVKLANQCRMTDCLSWVIDLNGGGLALAWLHAWEAAGRPGRPPIDWIADTPEKALAMAKALLRIAKARKPGYKHLEITANTDKLPVSPQVPGIVLDDDEIAELFSPKARRDPVLRETGDIIVQILELGRAVACNVENAALRATQDVVTEPQLVKQAALKIGMKSDEAEMAYLFGWSDRVSPDEAPYPGCGFIKVDDEPARPFKVFRIKPNQIRDIVAACADRQPELDDLSRRAAGEAYERRWENTDHLFGAGPVPVGAVAEEQQAVERPRTTGVTADWGNPTAPTGGDAQAAIDEAEAVRRRLHEAMSDATDRDPDTEQKFREILAAGGIDWGKPPQPQEPEAPAKPGADPRIGLVVEIVRCAGPQGINPSAVIAVFADTYPGQTAPSRSAVTTWLSADPRIHQPARGLYAFRAEEN
jgi:hypothetical protein